jgi:serine/threonine protein kinase/dipeptidyl aminopeptidase/acylaminoacyl peptidase
LAAVGEVAEVIVNGEDRLTSGQILGHYKIVEQIGTGGMGEVYLAEDTRLRRKLALKVLPENIASDKERLLRFEREAYAASALNHPNILTIHEFGAEDGVRLIATEYVEGETLRDRIKKQPLTFEETLEIAVQIASALSAAHEAKIIHRDIKPENVMLRRDGLLKVLDFGLAKLTEPDQPIIDAEAETRAQVKTQPGVVMGTVAYMSPEQARGKETDSRSDIWSLGCVIYEMLAGRTPFAGETTADRIASIIHKEPLPLSRLVENIPSRLEEIVSKCLEKNADERYQTVKDLLIDLRRLKKRLEAEAEMHRSAMPEGLEKTDGQTINRTQAISAAGQSDTGQTLHTTSSAEYVVTEIKRHKKGFALALAALCLVATAAAFLLYNFANQNKQPAPERKMQMTRLISGLSGVPNNVSISPDGKYVAYTLYEAGKASLWLRQVSQGTSLQILPPVEEEWIGGTTFSHDGEIVYFIGGNNKTNTLGSLYQIPVLGGKEPKKILDHVSSPISLSPDGKQFAFIRNYYPESVETAVMIANIDGSGEAKKIGSRKGNDWFIDVSWSPNAGAVVCAVMTATGGNSGTVVEISIEGGEEKAITNHKWEGILMQIKWIKDGSGLILNAGEKTPSGKQLWHVSYPDGKASRITTDLNDYAGVDITSDASTIVAILGEWTSRIWTAAPNDDEARAKRISNGKLDGRSGLALAPDGQRIIYISQVNDNRDVWIMNADGTDNKALTADGFGKYSARVSPDGRYIVFGYSRPDNISQIWRMDSDGGNLKQLTTGEDYNPSISPDGQWVVFHSFRNGKQSLWKVPIDGGEAVQVSDKIAHDPIFSPDGKLISCWYYDESAKPPRYRPALISFEDGQLVKMLDLPATARRPVWSSDGREFIYVDRRNSIDNIWSVPVAGGVSRQLTKFSSDLIDNFDLSRDGKRFVLSRATGNNDIVLIKDFR